MAAAWEQRSEIPFEGQDRAGHSIKGTLIRYLTSKGLRKDRNGLNALTEQDIRNIENGVASAVLMKHKGIRRRLDRILFEYESFRTGQNPNGHSVFQRIEFWKAGSGIISNNFWWGVGIGDVKRAFADQYNVMNSPLDEVHRLRAHNQWMTVWITSGLSGFLVFVLAWFTLFRRSSHARTMLFTAFFIIASLSFVTEDTLESQAGVSFFAFIGSVILFLPKRP
jgi:O-antigen ligase